jgi:prepilin peptidase CpaA
MANFASASPSPSNAGPAPLPFVNIVAWRASPRGTVGIRSEGDRRPDAPCVSNVATMPTRRKPFARRQGRRSPKSRLTGRNGDLLSGKRAEVSTPQKLFLRDRSVNTASWFLIAAVTGFTLTAAVWDFRTKRIPNWLTVSGLLVALAYHAVVGFMTGGFSGLGGGLLTAAAGFGVGFGILLVLWLIGGGGAGDVKLMGALGAWMGPWNTLVVFFVSTVFIIVLSVLVLAYQFLGRGMWGVKRKYLSTADGKRRSGESKEDALMRHKMKRRLLPYGVPVALAAWVVLAWSFREHWLNP